MNSNIANIKQSTASTGWSVANNIAAPNKSPIAIAGVDLSEGSATGTI